MSCSTAETARRMSVAAVARERGVGESTVWRWILKGVRGCKLETIVIGGRRFVLPDKLEDFDARVTAAANGDRPESVTPAAVARAEEKQLQSAQQACAAKGI